MEGIRDAEKMEKFTVIRHVKEKFMRNPFREGAEESTKPYFWEAVIEQLRISGLLNLKYVQVEGARDDAMLELTELGRDWFETSNQKCKLELKAIGLMYAFLKKKDGTPNVGQAVVKMFNFVCDDEKLKRFLYEVRNVLAAANNMLPFQVMTDTVIQQLVSHRPTNMNEFKSHPYEGFNADRLQRYAPTFVNAITKYKVCATPTDFCKS